MAFAFELSTASSLFPLNERTDAETLTCSDSSTTPFTRRVDLDSTLTDSKLVLSSADACRESPSLKSEIVQLYFFSFNG